MTSTTQVRNKDAELASVLNGSQSRHRSVRILFVQRDVGDVERCLQELKNVHFRVSADVVLTPEQFTGRLSSQTYDLVVAEYPCPNWESTQALELLHQSGKQIPLIFVSGTLERETVAEFITSGAYDCIEMDHIGHLPVAIRRALDEGNLRIERDRAEKMLKHSEAKYRALIGNLTYGICRCSLDGKFLDVNQALITMLGYSSREELLAASLARNVILDPATRGRLLGQSAQKDGTSPFETEWKAKNGTPLRVRLTGREVRAEQGAPESYEVIVEDVTKQRALEDQLRQRATRDALIWEAAPPTLQFSFVSKRAGPSWASAWRNGFKDRGFWFNHIHREDRERIAALWRAVLSGGRDHDFECRMLAADGCEI